MGRLLLNNNLTNKGIGDARRGGDDNEDGDLLRRWGDGAGTKFCRDPILENEA